MITTTVSIRITGKSHEDLLIQAKQRLSEFFDISLDEVPTRINFDLVVTAIEDANEFDDEEDEYEAEIIAKVKEHV